MCLKFLIVSALIFSSTRSENFEMNFEKCESKNNFIFVNKCEFKSNIVNMELNLTKTMVSFSLYRVEGLKERMIFKPFSLDYCEFLTKTEGKQSILMKIVNIAAKDLKSFRCPHLGVLKFSKIVVDRKLLLMFPKGKYYFVTVADAFTKNNEYDQVVTKCLMQNLD
ncbi:hypothetical protein PVAND_016512 [Polypedilum vanderplanki]|uniref:Uncharacterized protein n=1 Tax=Polypedilum vanderplanki TaxID=319348 RepID=A0A9J6BG50_POLVA|nr:hypothetical protein PVAND_016512 [Polypedilum vanderplanki]